MLPEITTDLDRPFLMITAENTRAAAPSVAEFWSHLRGWRLEVRADGAIHSAYEDVQALLPEGPDDDVAVLVARVDPVEEDHTLIHRFEATEKAAQQARHLVGQHLAAHDLPGQLAEDTVLATSELVTNAVLYGAGPLELRLRAHKAEVLVEVLDRATFQPRKLRPTVDDEHGRGLQIVAALSSRWGTRGTEDGKSVWCVLSAG